MKTIVEFGETTRIPCGTHAHHVCKSITEGAALSARIAFVMSLGKTDETCSLFFHLCKNEARKVWWSEDKTKFVSVSRLDGVNRGSFSSTLPLTRSTK
jgi:hypothetical protein